MDIKTRQMKKLENYWLISFEKTMLAILELKDMSEIRQEEFIKEFETDGYSIKKISKEQKDILLPKDVSLN